jgi:hypothetical protein
LALALALMLSLALALALMLLLALTLALMLSLALALALMLSLLVPVKGVAQGSHIAVFHSISFPLLLSLGLVMQL